jgi:hypothetical protein
MGHQHCVDDVDHAIGAGVGGDRTMRRSVNAIFGADGDHCTVDSSGRFVVHRQSRRQP